MMDTYRQALGCERSPLWFEELGTFYTVAPQQLEPAPAVQA